MTMYSGDEYYDDLVTSGPDFGEYTDGGFEDDGRYDDGRYDDDPNPYHGDYSED